MEKTTDHVELHVEWTKNGVEMCVCKFGEGMLKYDVSMRK